MNQEYEQLFIRVGDGPVLTAQDWPYRAHTIFNAAAVRDKEGMYLLLCRVEDFRGHSHLCLAQSKDGVTDWKVDTSPTFEPEPSLFPEEVWGVEDPRITYIPELDRFAVAYTSFSYGGPGVSIALTSDFRQFERLGVVMPPDDKDAALFPRKFDGKWLMLHRPQTRQGGHIWLSYSPDLKHWGEHRMILEAREGSWWDAWKIGLGPPPIETAEGWLMIYHGVRTTASGAIYRLGIALMDLERPHICIRRGATWIFGPERPYEVFGDVGNVVFPCGTITEPDGDTLLMYYGCADTSIGLAQASIKELLDWLVRS